MTTVASPCQAKKNDECARRLGGPVRCHLRTWQYRCAFDAELGWGRGRQRLRALCHTVGSTMLVHCSCRSYYSLRSRVQNGGASTGRRLQRTCLGRRQEGESHHLHVALPAKRITIGPLSVSDSAYWVSARVSPHGEIDRDPDDVQSVPSNRAPRQPTTIVPEGSVVSSGLAAGCQMSTRPLANPASVRPDAWAVRGRVPPVG
jgi:hypothetical protein